jgi:hypothetical protein
MGITTSAFSAGLDTPIIQPTVKFNGLIEMVYKKSSDSSSSSELFIDTVELGISAHLNDKFSANIVLEAAADDNGDLSGMQVDKVNLSGKIKAVDFVVGKLTVPFGAYQTSLISDSAGKSIGKTTDNALVLSSDINNLNFATWYAPDDDNNSGFSIAYKADNFTFGVDMITDALGVESGESTTNIDNQGIAIYGQTSWRDVKVVIEQVIVDVEGASSKKETQLEAAYTPNNWTFALRIDNGDTKSNAYGFSYKLIDGVNVSVESKQPDEGENTNELLLAYEF